MHRFHHAIENGVEQLAGLLGIAVGQEFHGAFEVGKQHRDLFAFAFQGTTRGQELLGQIGGRVREWCPPRRLRGGEDRLQARC